jgi:hypothetical protein
LSRRSNARIRYSGRLHHHTGRSGHRRGCGRRRRHNVRLGFGSAASESQRNSRGQYQGSPAVSEAKLFEERGYFHPSKISPVGASAMGDKAKPCLRQWPIFRVEIGLKSSTPGKKSSPFFVVFKWIQKDILSGVHPATTARPQVETTARLSSCTQE